MKPAAFRLNRVLIQRLSGCWLIIFCVVACSSCEKKSHPLLPVNDTPPTVGSDTKDAYSSDEDEVSESKVDDNSTPRLSDDVFERLIASTVRVITDEGDASGVILGKDPEGRVYLLTVEHAAVTNIRAVDLFSVTSPKHYKRIAPLEVMAVSERRDLAVLRSIEPVAENVGVTRIYRKLKESPKHAYSCGYATSKGPIPMAEKIVGKLAGIKPDETEPSTMWKIQKPQALGRSGGPLVDMDGSLIGIATGKDKKNGYYCHHSEIVDQLDELDLGWLVK